MAGFNRLARHLLDQLRRKFILKDIFLRISPLDSARYRLVLFVTLYHTINQSYQRLISQILHVFSDGGITVVILDQTALPTTSLLIPVLSQPRN
jgi:hypothetical protein